MSGRKSSVVVLVRVTTDVIKYHDQNKVTKENVYLAFITTSLFIIEGNQDRNSNKEKT